MEADNASSICIFCCSTFKSAEKPPPVSFNGGENDDSLPLFLVLLQRYLPIRKDLNESLKKLKPDSVDNHRRQLDSCPLCTKILTSFCDIYHQQEILNLQIQWKFQTLMGIMKNGGKVTSRIKNIKELFQEEGGDGDGNYKAFKIIRKELIQMGSQKISRYPPKVRLNRNLKIENSKASGEASFSVCRSLSLIEKPFENSPENIGRLHYWLMSFAAVVSLLSFSNKPEKINCTHEAIPSIQTLNDELSFENADESMIGLSNATFGSASSITETIKLEPSDPVSFGEDNFESDNEMNSMDVNSEDGTEMATEQKIAVKVYPSVSNDDSQSQPLKTEFFGDAKSCEMDSDLVDVIDTKHQLTIDTEKTNYSTTPNVQTTSASSRIEKRLLFACAHCPTTFKYMKGLQRHMRTKHPEQAVEIKTRSYNPTAAGPLSCVHCSNMYSNSDTLKRHMKVKHPEMMPKSGRKIFCKVCNIEIATYSCYLRHIKLVVHRRNMKKQNASASNQLFARKRQTENVSEAESVVLSLPTADQVEDCKVEVNATKPGCNLKTMEDQVPVKIEVNQDGGTSGSDSEDNINDYSASSSDTDKEAPPSAKKEKATRRKRKRLPEYFCLLDGCQYRAPNKLAYENHCKFHELGNYKCNFCDLEETNVVKLSMHEIEKHSENQLPDPNPDIFWCPRCPFEGYGRNSFINHFAWVHLNIQREWHNTCSICHVKVDGENHFKIAHDTTGVDPSKIIRCSEKGCSAEFINHQCLRRHKRQFHKVNARLSSSDDDHDDDDTSSAKVWAKAVHICPTEMCDKRFVTSELLDKHLKLHGSFQCQFCPVVKNYAPHLAVHELKHSSVKDYLKCSRCPFSKHLSQKFLYITHFLESHLDITNRFYECPACKVMFRCNKEKTKHFHAQHRKEGVDSTKMKKCPTSYQTNNSLKIPCTFPKCQEMFNEPEEVERHKKLHGQFNCLYCDFEASYAADLAFHEMGHADRTPEQSKSYNCSRCKNSFSVKTCYELHFVEKHLKLNPRVFACRICQAVYTSTKDVRKHFYKNHKLAGRNPSTTEKCESCPAYFLRKLQLLKHKKEQHQKNIFECLECKRVFLSKKRYTSHLVSRHKLGRSESASAFSCDAPGCTKRYDKEDDLIWHKHGAHKPTKSTNKKKT